MEIAQREKPRPRRTQQERRDATRERLLDATLACLAELGYAGTSTTEIVRRAGLSRGAQVHHFPTKAELVREAIVRLARRQREELHRTFELLRDDEDRASLATDLLWSLYAGPLFEAALELLVAARTDPELRPGVSALQRDIRALFESMWEELLGPGALRDETLRGALDLTIDLLHGLALGRLLDGHDRHERRVIARWKELLGSMLAVARR